MRAASWEVLDAAYAAGIRWVDVARSYGRAEEFLAGWLADRGHTGVRVSSKWGYRYTADWRPDAEVHEVKEHSLGRFRTQWAQTRALLGQAVSVYQVHSLTPDSPLFTDPPLLDALAGLRAEGVTVGFSTSGPAQADTVRRAFELESAGERVFSLVQSTWNVLEPSAGAALDEAHRAGNTVLLKEVLANGRLAVDPPAAFAAAASDAGVTPDALAVCAAARQPFADGVLLGPASPAQLAANLAETTAGYPADLAEPPERYWATRSALPWH
ncbi:aldo/keto reductase [Amycolatopsis suaedae]|uniref:Aldo/keto reductase n=2 Tax=Amycolatopsis suaedae TaxID=2510978 RepID=A0A4Q7J9R3_9PSEU|nr:aldo/keto reductase [Amycolatopsis suaedae]